MFFLLHFPSNTFQCPNPSVLSWNLWAYGASLFLLLYTWTVDFHAAGMECIRLRCWCLVVARSARYMIYIYIYGKYMLAYIDGYWTISCCFQNFLWSWAPLQRRGWIVLIQTLQTTGVFSAGVGIILQVWYRSICGKCYRSGCLVRVFQ